MPAAVPLAIVGSAAVGAAASSSAAKKTTKAAQQTAQSNNDLQREVYNRNSQNMQPFLAGGNKAFAAWQDFMGLNARAPAAATAQYGEAQMVPEQTGSPGRPVNALARDYGGSADLSMSPMARKFEGGGIQNALALTDFPDGREVMPLQPGGPQVQTPAVPSNALSGYDQFKASTGYETGLAEGYRGLNARLAGQGRLQSGDAQREAIRYGQNYADTFATGWLDRLMQGTQVGTGAANALAGVGSNYANAVGANNNNALNATANANASNASTIGGLAGAAGSAAAYYYGNRSAPTASSYGGGNTSSGYGRPIFWG